MEHEARTALLTGPEEKITGSPVLSQRDRIKRYPELLYVPDRYLVLTKFSSLSPLPDPLMRIKSKNQRYPPSAAEKSSIPVQMNQV
jgi:hypothetical protein